MTIFIISLFVIILGCINCNSDNDSNSNSDYVDERFAASSITSPVEGYIDSIFINAMGNRIYFLHSKLAPNDFLSGTINYSEAELLTGHTVGAGLDWNTDLYYIEWNGSSWSVPVNLGSADDGTKINSLANESCVWLNETETEIIFYRENLGLPVLGENGNYRATRATINDSWSQPVPLDATYGTVDQSTDRYRHDIQKTASGDLYLWEHDDTYVNKKRLLYGEWNDATWLAPVIVPGTDSADDETQPWVSADEMTLLFNRRAATGNTKLMCMTRADTSAAWSNLVEVSLDGFADPAGMTVWGEPTFSSSESYMLYIRFDTSKDPWKADIMFSIGCPCSGFGPPVRLN